MFKNHHHLAVAHLVPTTESEPGDDAARIRDILKKTKLRKFVDALHLVMDLIARVTEVLHFYFVKK